MLKSSLLEILRTFTKEDLVKFEDFVKSPYYNKNSNVVRLFMAIRKFAPGFIDAKLSKEEVWKKIYPDKKYNYGIMKNLIHELSKLSEEFLKQEFYGENKMRNDQDLCYAVYKKNLFKLLISKYAAFEKKYTEKAYISSNLTLWEYYACLADFHALKSFTTMAYTKAPDAESELILEADYDLYNLLLKSLHSMANYRVGKKFNKEKYRKINLLEELLNFLTPSYIENLLVELRPRSEQAYLLINSYYMMFKAFEESSAEVNYFDFKKAVFGISGKASSEDFRVLVRCLTICLGIIKPRELNMHREMFEINNLMLENNIFLEDNGFLSEIHFNKYISYCCTCHEAEIAEKFLHGYSLHLAADSKDSCVNYGLAEINFAKGEYKKSLENLTKVNNIYFDLKFSSKSLHIMNCYELDDFESFLYLLDSGKHLAKYNEPLENDLTNNFKKFLEIVSALFELKRNPAESNIMAIKETVNNSYPYRKTWLLEKIVELQK